MRPLIIDETAKKRIAMVVAHAEANPFTMDDLLDMHNKAILVAGGMNGYTCYLDLGFKVVYSIEKQKQDVRHISISVDTLGMMPNPCAVEEIIKLFGFQSDLAECMIKFEDITKGHQAVNVWEVIK